MRRLIYALYAVVIGLIGISIYMAHVSYDGLVEHHYYERSVGYFGAKKAEEAGGLKLMLPHELKKGPNTFAMRIESKSGPVTNSKGILYIGSVSTVKYDNSYALRETSDGTYIAFIEIPHEGRWIFRVEFETKDGKVFRRWDVDVTK